jgi:hypothetical protein
VFQRLWREGDPVDLEQILFGMPRRSRFDAVDQGAPLPEARFLSVNKYSSTQLRHDRKVV